MDELLDSLTGLYNRPWYHPSWLNPWHLVQEFEFQNAGWFWGLTAIPLLFVLRWFMQYRFNQKLAVAQPKKQLQGSAVAYLRFLPDMVLILVLALLVIALARPQKSDEKVEQWTEGIDIMLAIDVSLSMKMMDLEPDRLQATKEVATSFINGRFQDRIGLTIFSGEAFTLSPLTTDYDLLSALIEDEIDFDKIQAQGTAIGSAIGVVTLRMEESNAKSKVGIILSDGDNNAGNIDPITAAKIAADEDIKLYTIAVGKNGQVPYRDEYGRINMTDSQLNEATLREIAKIGNGKFYRVTDNETLNKVFREIDAFEKVEIKENRYTRNLDFYHIYLRWAMCFLLLWLLLKSSFISNVLQD